MRKGLAGWLVALALGGLLAPQAKAAPPQGLAPGTRPSWTTGCKQGIGTALDRRSRVWFTLAEGGLTEVYYPTIDAAQLRALELVVSDGQSFAERESLATRHEVQLLDPQALVYKQINTASSGAYRIEKTYATVPDADALAIEVRVVSTGAKRPLKVYVVLDPALANSAHHDSARVQVGAILAWERDLGLALVGRPPLGAPALERVGDAKGLRAVLAGQPPSGRRAEIDDADVAAWALLGTVEPNRSLVSQLALGFAASPQAARAVAEAAAARRFGEVQRAYAETWHRALERLWVPSDAALAARYRVAYMTLRAHEDKTFPGAMIASLSVPWGEVVDASEPTAGGYHLVWARDLYQVATALDAAGDRAAAERALDYLLGVQQRPDGSFPQNSWLDGRPYYDSLQLDEVSLPIVLAHQLGRTDALTWAHLRRAAQFVIEHGPATPQERWEEEHGYSPATLAAEIAGLVCAAELARAQKDAAGPVFLAVADAWQRQIEHWTTARGGRLGDHYVRIAQSGRPDAGDRLVINNGGGTWDEREVIDAGFLELVRLGIRRADDLLVRKSLAVVDHAIRVETPFGPGFYRYNHDGYGEKDDGSGWDGTGRGRLWPLLTGERGEYLLAARQDARPLLQALARFANQGLLIPEQVWDRRPPADPTRLGQGTGSATPLAWSMAELIRLARGIELGRVVGQPEPVARRYTGPAGPPPPLRLSLSEPADGAHTESGVIQIAGTSEARQVLVHVGGRTTAFPVVGGAFRGQVAVVGAARLTVAAVEGARSAAIQRQVRGAEDKRQLKPAN